MNLTDKILAGMHGRLDITVVRKGGPYVPLHVVGAASSGLNSPWTDLPVQFRQDKMVYIVHGEDVQGRQFIFAEDTEIIDAPASAVVEAMLDMIADIDSENALTPSDVVDILEGRSVSPDEWDEDDDWICEGSP
jgi:hypothetical protein